MRERLIAIIKNSLFKHIDKSCNLAENITDDLLENGVVVFRCKVGDDIYRIGDNGIIYGDWQILYIQKYQDEIVYIDDSNNYFLESEIGKTVFLSQEDAERALRKEGGTNGSE